LSRWRVAALGSVALMVEFDSFSAMALVEGTNIVRRQLGLLGRPRK
jgi:hypothetical protein